MFYRASIFRRAICVVCFSFSISAQAQSDSPGDKPFFRWLWEEQIKPTSRESVSYEQSAILLSTTAATVIARQYDSDVRADYGNHGRMPAEISRYGDWLGSGYPGAVIAITQLVWDRPEGLAMARTLLFTGVSHQTIARLVNRERPNQGPHSFPSGHTSTSFAAAGSLAYSYGAWVGVPALMLATFVGASRVADNAHWFSDTVAAAGLGLFWARASYRAGQAGNAGAATTADRWSDGISPGVVPGGFILNLSRAF